MITKQCKKCGEEKDPSDDFYANDNTCKECRKAMVRANRAMKIEYYREYDKARASNPSRVAARKDYASTDAGIESAKRAKKKWSDNNEKKRRAHNEVNNAIRDGKMKKPCACESCGASGRKINGHHDDYEKPLDVRWLCSLCHRKWHSKNGQGLNAS